MAHPGGPASRSPETLEAILRAGADVARLNFSHGSRPEHAAAIESIRRHKAAYLMAVGGAAYLVSKAIRKSRVVAFAELGMEAIYEFEVKDMPVTVAVDANGESVHQTGPTAWAGRIRELGIPVRVA